MDDHADDTVGLTRHEERLQIGTREESRGVVRIRTTVDGHVVSEPFDVDVEEAHVDRADANEQDSGQIEELPDGSLSIPVFEEQLVVTRRLVVRERIVVGKRRTTHTEHIETELRTERVDVVDHTDHD